MLLRQFLYLDDRLTREFLAQAEGGIFKERRETWEAGKSGKAGGKAGAGMLGLEAGGESHSSEHSDRVMEQTDASEFDRLYKHLSKNKVLKEVSSLDEKGWASLKRGEFVEIEAELALSGMATIRQLMQAFVTLAPLADAFGSKIDPETRAKADSMQQFGFAAAGPTLPVIVRLVGGSPYRFRSILDRKYLRYEDKDLAGEAVVVGKIGRKLEPGQTFQLEDIVPGLDLDKIVDRAKLEVSLRSTPGLGASIGEMSLPFPAADIVPVAVFR